MVKLWLLDGEKAVHLSLHDMTSLDAVTRALPSGFYTTFRTYRARTCALGLKAHLARLYRPARSLGILPTADIPLLRKHLAALLNGFRADEARIRLILTTAEDPGSIHIAIEPLKFPPPEIYRNGVAVITTRAHRDHPELKSTAFIAESQPERRRLAKGAAYEGLIVANGRILEGITSNFFYIRDAILGTARRGILNGVTRREVLRVAVEQGLHLAFRSLQLSQVGTIREAFLTSSSRGIVPIITIDGIKVGAGRVGEWTSRLMKAYEAHVQKRIEPIRPQRREDS